MDAGSTDTGLLGRLDGMKMSIVKACALSGFVSIAIKL